MADVAMLNDMLGGMEGSLDAVRASNIEALDVTHSQAKKTSRDLLAGRTPSAAKGKGKRAASGGDPGQSSSKKASAPKKPKISMADVKMQQTMNAKELAANKGFLTKLRILSRYRSDPLLWPIIKAQGDPAIVLKGKEDSEKGVDIKLDHFRSVLASAKIDEAVLYGLEAGCKVFETVTGEGEMLGMDLRGFTPTVMDRKDEIELELAQLKAEYGDWLKFPWYARMSAFFMRTANDVNAHNRGITAASLDARDPTPL